MKPFILLCEDANKARTIARALGATATSGGTMKWDHSRRGWVRSGSGTGRVFGTVSDEQLELLKIIAGAPGFHLDFGS